MSWRARTSVVVATALLVACASGTRPPGPVATIAPAAADLDAGGGADGGDDDDDDAGTTGEVALSTEEGPCPADMVLVAAGDMRVCVDRWEGSLVEIDGDGNEKPFPHWLPVDGHTVRAVSVPDVFPQGYISEVQAEDACAASHKRLCTETEWMTACTGPAKTTFPYGDARRPTACHDSGRSAVGAVFGLKALASSPPGPPISHSNAPPPGKKGAKPAHSTDKKAASTTKSRAPSKKTVATKPVTPTKKKGKPPPAARASARPSSVDPSVWHQLNDPRLGQVEGALSKTGSHEDCTNGYGALDMMGNLHEWVRTPASAPHGTFAGGYYLDTTLNGDGCRYRTKAHAHDYHDYSTGFRCCADAR